jgi:hypothetical protein
MNLLGRGCLCDKLTRGNVPGIPSLTSPAAGCSPALPVKLIVGFSLSTVDIIWHKLTLGQVLTGEISRLDSWVYQGGIFMSHKRPRSWGNPDLRHQTQVPAPPLHKLDLLQKSSLGYYRV